MAEGLERMAMNKQRTEKAAEGETPISGEEVEGETLVERGLEGETPISDDVEKGLTHVFDNAGEGKTLVDRNPEGETPVLCAEGETPRNPEGETPVVSVEGKPQWCLLRGNPCW